MPFSNINRQDLIKARSCLSKIHECLPSLLKFGNLESAKLSDQEKDEVIKL